MAPIAGSIALGFAAYFAYSILKKPVESEKMRSISAAIQEGAMAFLKREYSAVSIFVVIVAVVIALLLGSNPPVPSLSSLYTALAYVFGAVLSATAGFIGMRIATKANARTTSAAQTGGLVPALEIAFKGGSVMGMTVAGLGLLGLSVAFLIFQVIFELPAATQIIVGFGLGASSIALFARVGGGIFTKAADVGADLVGKIEAGIPEDDPRNPAVIADNVGDNVGDVAGMGADLYESYVGSIIAPIVLGAVIFPGIKGMLLPLLIASMGIIVSIIGTYFVKTQEGGHPGRALSIGTYTAAVLSAIGSFFLVWGLFGIDKIGFFWAILAGLVAGMAIGQISEYYTSDKHKPVKNLANTAKTSAATVILEGISEGMLSTTASVIVLVIAIAV
ncbi:MAG: sodium-translocating pyrophosphatase, partial [Actinobacteria bacterium]